MGQAEVFDVLKNSNVPLSSREIASILNTEEFKVTKILNVLIRFNEVETMDLNKELSMKFYKCKRRMRLYYV